MNLWVSFCFWLLKPFFDAINCMKRDHSRKSLLEQQMYIFIRVVLKLLSVVAVLTLGPVTRAAEFEAENLVEGTTFIFVSGDIESGDEVKFRRLSLEHPKAIIALHSDGGKLMPALEIGKIIRLAGYETMVGDNSVCTSSCALIWLAGSPRLLATAGKIGFHASYRDNEGKLEETGVGNAVIGHYLSMLNLPQRAVVFATSASPTEIMWLTSDNARASGIDFEPLASLDAPEPTAELAMDAKPSPPMVRTITPPNPSGQRPISDYSLDEIKTMFKANFRKREFLNAEFAKMNLYSGSLTVMVDHALQLYSNDIYIDRVAEEIFAARAGFSGNENDRAIAMSIGQATNIKLTLAGLSRLPDADVRLYIYYITQILANASDTECRAIATGKDEFGRSEIKQLAKLGDAKFAEYLALTRRAALAELRDNPMKIVPSKVETEAGESSFVNYFTKQFDNYNEPDKNRLLAAFAALDTANDKDACDSYFLTFKSIYELGGMPGNWKRRALINSLRE